MDNKVGTSPSIPRAAMQHNFALYDDTTVLDQIFGENEIALLFTTLAQSRDYPRSIWGNWMKARDLCILAALRYMLLRPKEACKIKHIDININLKQLHVRGENNKQRKDRFLQLPEKFLEFYKFYMSFPKWMWKSSPYLFPSAENEYISPERWKTIMREKILKPSGLYKQREGSTIPITRSYLLRATGATNMLDNGADPWTVAQTLGHGDLRTIKNYFFQTNKFRKNQKDFLDTLS